MTKIRVIPNLLRILLLSVLTQTSSLAQHNLTFCYQVATNSPHWGHGAIEETTDSEWVIDCYEDQTYSINGKTYMKVYSDFVSAVTSSRSTATGTGDDNLRNFTLGIRMEDGKVYVNYVEYLDHLSKTGFHELVNGFLGNPDYVPYHLTDDGELILYDYTMEVGDMYRHVEGYEDVSVVEKDMVRLNNGADHRRLTLSNGLILVEGLGCTNSTGLLLDYLNPAGDMGWLSARLVWAQQNSDYIFKDENYTPPVNGMATVNESAKSSSLHPYYDLQGRRNTGHHHTNGIFIENNKKTTRR